MKHRIHDMVVALVTSAISPVFAQAPPAPQPVSPGATGTASTAAARNTANSTTSITGSSSPAGSTPAQGTGPANVRIGRVLLGSGEPGGGPGGTVENATEVYNNIYHVPQYMPYFPTAATIWPRVIEVPCRTSGADMVCDRYYWLPEYGRGEYLFFTPMVQAGAGQAPPSTGPAGSQQRQQ